MKQSFISIDLSKAKRSGNTFTFDFNVLESCKAADFVVLQNVPIGDAVATACPFAVYRQGNVDYIHSVNLSGARFNMRFTNNGYSMQLE